MTRESKIGVAMVLLILGVVGFFAYKRFTRPQDSVAQTESQSADDADSKDDAVPANDDNGDEEFPPLRQPAEPEILPVAATSSRQIPDEETETVDDPFGETATFPPTKSQTPIKPNLPTEVPDEQTEFADDGAGEFVVESGAADEPETTFEPAEPVGAASDPFGETTTAADDTTGNGAAAEPEMVFEEEPAVETENAASDPFFAEPETVTRGPAAVDRELGDSTASSAAPDLLDEPETVSVQARTTLPEPEFDFEDAAEEPEATEPLSEPNSIGSPSAAPDLAIDESQEDRYGGFEPVESVDGAVEPASFGGESRTQIDFFDADDHRTPITITGDSHEIQPGENFWSISRKKYGTGRYFQALAAHNQSRVPDPLKMKPGVTVALPTEAELERRYAALIPKGGRSEPAAADPQANHPGEFFTGQDGRPLYRIGSRDTLSQIAQRYLGRSTRWVQIFEMNRDVLKDGNTLKVGAVVRLPADASDLQLSSQPRAFR